MRQTEKHREWPWREHSIRKDEHNCIAGVFGDRALSKREQLKRIRMCKQDTLDDAHYEGLLLTGEQGSGHVVADNSVSKVASPSNPQLVSKPHDLNERQKARFDRMFHLQGDESNPENALVPGVFEYQPQA